MARAILAALVLALAAGCGAGPAGQIRYKNQPVVWHVNDRADIPRPAERPYVRTLYHIDGYAVRKLTRLLDFPEPTRATNVNALDEVPDSTWFTNRIGVRDLSLEEIKRGPNFDETPEAHKPWTVTGTKVGGKSAGFLMKDARGQVYILKFDSTKGPELETSADIIVQRLLWACGYNVPEDYIVHFTRDDLIVAEDASKKDVFGNKSAMTTRDLDDNLARANQLPDGSYRGLASKFLPGKPIGPYAREGTRGDDPNDVIPHEQRRELRGQTAIFAWLQHTDLQEDNTLDMWHEDAGGTHYVKHYLIDFGKALGVMAYQAKRSTPGHTYLIDFRFALQSIFTFGLAKRPWDDIHEPGIPGVGLYEVDDYDPGKWRANSPYWPFEDADRFDKFWGSKIIMRFTREQLQAAVLEGELTDPNAVEYLVNTLIARQRKTAQYWFRKVAPLDQFEVRKVDMGWSLCFDDLTIKYDLDEVAEGTSYIVRIYDYNGRATDWKETARADTEGRTCTSGFPAGAGHESYTIVRIVTRRGHWDMPATLVHLAMDPDSKALRVIGLRRQ